VDCSENYPRNLWKCKKNLTGIAWIVIDALPLSSQDSWDFKDATPNKSPWQFKLSNAYIISVNHLQ